MKKGTKISLIVLILVLSVVTILLTKNVEESQTGKASKTEFEASIEIKADDTWNYIINNDGLSARLTEYKGNDENVVIPEYIDGYKVTAITPNRIYRTMQYVKNLYISENLTDIGFAYDISWLTGGSMPYLESITVNENNEQYKSVNGVLYTKNGKTIMVYPANKEGDSYTILDGVQVISYYTFYR